MDLIQLYTATQRVVQSLKTSGLMPALAKYRASLRGQSGVQGDRAASESVLMQASEAYVEKTAMFGEHEAAVVNLLHLGQLGTASFWLDMTSNVRSIEVRQAQAVSAYSKMMFATSHLPGLLALVRETSAVEGLRADDSGGGSLVVRLYDSIEPASNPDRLSRLIDAIDIIYTSCASLSEPTPDSLKLMSVSGVAVRSVIFHGEVETVNATRKIISHLNQMAAGSHQSDSYSVEAIASEMPFLDALDELQQLDAISSDVADGIGRDVQEGAIMLLECGAQLIDHDSVTESGYIPASLIAKLDADGKSFDTIDSRIGESIVARYDEVYDREKLKLVNETVSEKPAVKSTGTMEIAASASVKPSLRGERTASSTAAPVKERNRRADGIDELIIDLNRLYGEQRQ